MLQLRPTCEHCQIALPPHSVDAVICSFECTFCQNCAYEVLHNVCPNCGGGFSARPIRPARPWKAPNFLGDAPASSVVVWHPVDLAMHDAFAASIKEISPEQR